MMHETIATRVTGFSKSIFSLSSAHSTVPTAPSVSSIRHTREGTPPPHIEGFTEAKDTVSYPNSVMNPRIAASPSCTVFYSSRSSPKSTSKWFIMIWRKYRSPLSVVFFTKYS